ncbi:hypothetical protein ABPG72_022841 [Tetrahymena utriculariae]
MEEGKSEIWKYFIKSKTNPQEAICQIDNCQKIIQRGGSDKCKPNTSNQRTHIETHHKDIFKLIEKAELFKKTQKVDFKQPTINQMIRFPLSDQKKQKINELVAQIIIKDLQPYTLVEDVGFINLLSELKPKYQILSRIYFSDTLIPQLFSQKVESITKILKEQCESASFTCDGWESRSSTQFVSLIIHFLNQEFQVRNFLLELFPLKMSHTSEKIRNHIFEKITKWGLQQQNITALIHDNAANMKSAFQNLNLSAPCTAHSLQLLIKDATQGKKKYNFKPNKPLIDMISIVRTVVSHFKKQCLSQQIMESIADNTLEESKQLLLDSPTR